MLWIFLALGAAFTLAIVQILDKLVMFRYVRSPLSLPFWVGLVQSAFGLTLILFLPWSETASFSSIVWGLLSGACLGLSAIFLLRVLYSQEVSRTIPIFSTFPIFAALIGVFFLNETLSSYHWLAIFATAIGAILISLRRDQEFRRLFLHRSFYLLITGSIIAAASYVTGKVALEDLPVLNAHSLRSLGTGIVLLLASTRPEALRDIRDLIHRRSPVFIIFGCNFVLANTTLFLTVWALSLGPVSLVTTLITVNSLFVVLFSTALALRFSGFLGEEVSPSSVATKIVATALIVAGVATITLA